MSEKASPLKKGASSRAATPPPKEKKVSDEKVKPKAEAAKEKEEPQEFGGPAGNLFIMVSSHILMYCMAASLFGSEPTQYIPTVKSVSWFLSYHALQVLSARYMPGVLVQTNGLDYPCNGYLTFWASFLVAGLLHFGGIFDLTTLVKEYPSFMSTAIILGDIYSLIIHACYAKGKEIYSIYDFFMGTALHPRVGKLVDVKMVAETRLSWTLLLMITVGCYLETFRLTGSWLNPTGFMVLAHLLYGQACAKGEHFIPYTWDITTEKFGWMLCWWNLAGVPLLYCYQSLFLCKNSWSGLVLPPLPGVYYAVISVLLVLMYCLWDEANYQKCYFKAEMRGQLIRRDLFPTFRHIESPKYIKCDQGVLLIDGWYGKARKMHYTADTAMALLWGLGCGFGSFLPYFYFCFFCAMITHRAIRDEERCKRKYGATWDKYLQAVPYRFIPGVW